MIEFEGINSFLVGMSNILLKDGCKRNVRGNVCYELPYPVLIKIKNPRARLVTIPERGWNPFLPYVESLWLGLGRNDLSMPGYYLKRLSDFSDDGVTIRAGYGPRFRYWKGGTGDYNIGFHRNDVLETTDQFKYVLDVLKFDPNSRQAIITLGDPEKDSFDSLSRIKKTYDRPCTRNIQFIINEGKLDAYVHMRSNDFMWGATGVNIFNFTLLQEVFSGILNVDVGSYYHMANNFHYYERHQSKIERLSKISDFYDKSYIYKTTFESLKDYDFELQKLEEYEAKLRVGDFNHTFNSNNDFMLDWASVILSSYRKVKRQAFFNPILDKIINK